MPYGFPKISTKECRQAILDAIAREIDKRHEFAGVGNCFFGYEFECDLKITVVTRGERTIDISKQAVVEQHPGCVEAPGCPEPVGHDSPHTETAPVEVEHQEITITVGRKKGKPSKAAREKANA